jgi:hypothetical protein
MAHRPLHEGRAVLSMHFAYILLLVRHILVAVSVRHGLLGSGHRFISMPSLLHRAYTKHVCKNTNNFSSSTATQRTRCDCAGMGPSSIALSAF